ncbi:hypothetical protein D3C81_2191940 [compost metagenome]
MQNRLSLLLLDTSGINNDNIITSRSGQLLQHFQRIRMRHLQLLLKILHRSKGFAP